MKISPSVSLRGNLKHLRWRKYSRTDSFSESKKSIVVFIIPCVYREDMPSGALSWLLPTPDSTECL